MSEVCSAHAHLVAAPISDEPVRSVCDCLQRCVNTWSALARIHAFSIAKIRLLLQKLPSALSEVARHLAQSMCGTNLHVYGQLYVF